MSSWQAQLSSFVIRHTIKRKLAAAKDAAGIRRIFDRGGRYKPPAGVRITPAAIHAIPGEWVESGSTAAGLMLFLHGGGYVACTLKTHRPYSCFFAGCGFRVFAAEYRLAPEQPFPAGLNDAVEAYRGLRTAYPDAAITIAGDSAGGGLALATMLRLRAEGDLLPAAAALFSPFTDLTGAGESRVSNNLRCAMFYRKGLDLAAQLYLPGAPPEAFRNPLVSPVYAELHGLPPLLIHVGEDETLRDDSVRLAERAVKAGVEVTLKIWPRVPHDWQLLYTMVPEGLKSLQESAAFLRKHVSAAHAIAPV